MSPLEREPDTLLEREREGTESRERKNGGSTGGGRGGVRFELDDGEGGSSQTVHREPLQSSEEEHTGTKRKVHAT